MASGQRVGGVLFEDLFDPDIVGDGPTAPGYRGSDGQPLRFAHIKYGSKRADVGRRIAGSDVANLWAMKGSAVYTLPFHGRGYSSGNQAKTNSTGSATAQITISLRPDGTYAITTSISGGGNGNSETVDSGVWLPAGSSAAQFEVRLEGVNLGDATFSTGASAFVSLSNAQSATVKISCNAASSDSMAAATSINVYLRRVGASAQLSTFGALVSATGWY